MKVVLVTGGRAYRDLAQVAAVLDEEAPDLIIHGGARTWDPATRTYSGADYYAGAWADEHDVPQLRVPYRRDLGKAGGPMRNGWAVDFLADLRLLGNECKGIAFPGGGGTADTVRKLRFRGFTPRIIPS